MTDLLSPNLCRKCVRTYEYVCLNQRWGAEADIFYRETEPLKKTQTVSGTRAFLEGSEPVPVNPF